MEVLQINPALRESLFSENASGKKRLDEGAFAEAFVESNHLVCYNGNLYDRYGNTIGSAEGQHAIYNILRGLYITTGMASRTKSLWETIKLQAYVDRITVPENQIALQNGTITIDPKTGEYRFDEKLTFSLNRLNCKFDPNAETPKRFLEWVDNLIHDYDKLGFQEYLGYLLLASTRLQKALVLLGRGQEGKSRVGLILHYLFGGSCVSSSVEYFETNQFAMPRAENKLVLFQDDLKREKLKSTEVFKMMVSAEVPMQAEQEGEPSYSFQPYARWVICSNAPLTALSDSGHGFYRRLYVIRVKNRPADRKDDPYYFEPMKEEMDGIFLWMLQGLQRLIRNGWRLSVSEESQELVNSQQEQQNSLIGFMSSKLAFGSSSYSITKVELQKAYVSYCTENQLIPEKKAEMWNFFEEQMDNLKIKKSKHLGDNRGAEGYVGMCLKSTAAVIDLLDDTPAERR